MQQNNNNPPLNPIYLWIPLWLGFIALAFILQKQYLSDSNLDIEMANAPVNTFTDGHLTVQIHADQQGHYIFKGAINSHPVNFLLDTGATVVAIPASIAKHLKLRKGNRITIETANGQTNAYATWLKQVSVGKLTIHDVKGVIVPSMPGQMILLGMSFLKHLTIRQSKGVISLALPEKNH